MLKPGIKVRYIDVDRLYRLKNVNILEFHLSDDDLSIPIEKDYALPVAFHCPEYYKCTNGYRQLINPCSNDNKIKTMSRDLILRTIDYVENNKKRFLGAPKIIMHPGGMSKDNKIINTEELLDNLLKFISIIDYKDNVFMLENMPPFPWFYGGSWISNIFIDEDEVAKFCEDSNINICLDISHAGLACKYLNKNVKEYINKLLPYVEHIHIADSVGISGEGIQIDNGDIEFVKIFEELRKLDNNEKDIYIVPEVWYSHYNDHKESKIAIEKIDHYIKRK